MLPGISPSLWGLRVRSLFKPKPVAFHYTLRGGRGMDKHGGCRWLPSVVRHAEEGEGSPLPSAADRRGSIRVHGFSPPSVISAEPSTSPQPSCPAAHPRVPLIRCPMQRGPFPPSSATLGGPMLRCSILLVEAPGRKPTQPHETWIQKPWCKNSLPTGTPHPP